MSTNNVVMWVTRLSMVDWVFFKTKILLATLRSHNQLGRCLVYLWKPNIWHPISWMCKKQTSVSHSSTVWEIISLDAGLRMDGSRALDLRDVVIEVLRSTDNTAKQCRQAHGNLCTAGNHSRTEKRKARG